MGLYTRPINIGAGSLSAHAGGRSNVAVAMVDRASRLSGGQLYLALQSCVDQVYPRVWCRIAC